MNEVLAVLYLCFVNENFLLVEEKFIESDLFVIFTSLMESLRGLFLRELDKEDSGLNGFVIQYKKVLEITDPELYEVLEIENQIPH